MKRRKKEEKKKEREGNSLRKDARITVSLYGVTGSGLLYLKGIIFSHDVWNWWGGKKKIM